MRQIRGFRQLRRAAMIAFAAGFSSPALAYIDPGTGSMLLQVIGAGVAGAIFYFRELRYKVLSMFSRRPAPTAEESGEQPADDPPR
jgi:hypothetical protein